MGSFLEQNCEAPSAEEKDRLRAILEGALPCAFARTTIENYLPGIISYKTLRNLECKGKGPKSFYLGRKRFYEKQDFIDWFLGRIKTEKA